MTIAFTFTWVVLPCASTVTKRSPKQKEEHRVIAKQKLSPNVGIEPTTTRCRSQITYEMLDKSRALYRLS